MCFKKKKTPIFTEKIKLKSRPDSSLCETNLLVESELLLMAVTMVRLLTLLPGDAGTCRVTEDGNVMGCKKKGGEGKETVNSTFQKRRHTF